MTAISNLVQQLGDTWAIAVDCNNEAGDPVNLAGATLTWEVIGTPLLVNNGTGISIVSSAAGTALITVTPAQQTAANLSRGYYGHRFRITTATGDVNTQAKGRLSIE